MKRGVETTQNEPHRKHQSWLGRAEGLQLIPLKMSQARRIKLIGHEKEERRDNADEHKRDLLGERVNEWCDQAHARGYERSNL